VDEHQHQNQEEQKASLKDSAIVHDEENVNKDGSEPVKDAGANDADTAS